MDCSLQVRSGFMCGTVMVKRELSPKAKLRINQLIYVSVLTYGHKLCIVKERIRWWIQAVEMSWLGSLFEIS